MSKLNERLKLIRQCTKQSQVEFGRKLNISAQLVSKWECTDFNPSLEDILKISNTYNVSTEFIINGIPNETDKKFLERLLTEEEIKNTLKQEFTAILSKSNLVKYIDNLVDCAKISEQMTVQTTNVRDKILFNIEDIVEIANYDLCTLLFKYYNIKGRLKFEQLNPNKHSLQFYEEALKCDRKNIEPTFLRYTSNKELWNDEIILWLINQGAVCMELVDIKETKSQNYSIEGCPDTIITYKPTYKENLILTFLLKSELERKISYLN